MPLTELRPWRRLFIPLVAAGLLGLAACSTPAATTSSTGSDTGTTPANTANAAMDAYRTCLSQNGVTLPERGAGQRGDGGVPPSGSATPPSPPADGAAPPNAAGGARPAPPGVDAATWTAAQQACADLRPARPSGTAAAQSG